MTTMLDVDTADTIRAATRGVCSPSCLVAPALRAHHDRLLRMEHDADEVLELMELAVTWGELEYDAAVVIGPESWVAFAATHHWAEPDRVERIFGLALDIAARAEPPLRRVTPAV